MKVLLIQPDLSYRGGERVAINLAEGLKQIHLSSTLFFMRTQIQHNELISPDLDVKILPNFLNNLIKNNLLFIFLSTPILFAYLLFLIPRYDIIHTYGFPCLYPSVIVGKLFKKKVIWTSFAIEKGTDSSESILAKCFRKIIFAIDKIISRYVDAIVTISPLSYRQIKQTFSHPQTHMIIPPIDFDRLDNASSNKLKVKLQLEHKKVLLLVGVLHPKKNQELAIHTLALLLKADPTYALVLVGGGDQSKLKQCADQYNISSSIIFAGFVSEKEIKDYYQAADILLQTSISDQEGLGYTPLEALYQKKISIAVHGSGIAEILKTEQIGLVSEPNAEQLAHTIQDYFSNPSKFEKIIDAGYKYVKQNLISEQYAKKVSQIYTSLNAKPDISNNSLHN